MEWLRCTLLLTVKTLLGHNAEFSAITSTSIDGEGSARGDKMDELGNNQNNIIGLKCVILSTDSTDQEILGWNGSTFPFKFIPNFFQQGSKVECII